MKYQQKVVQMKIHNLFMKKIVDLIFYSLINGKFKINV